MYGCSQCRIVYGWYEFNNVICDKWLTENGIGLYTTEVIKFHAGGAVYGIPCEFDHKTGKAIVTEEEKEIVEKAYNKFMKYYKKYRPPPEKVYLDDDEEDDGIPKIKYNYAIEGDMSWECLEEYNPDDYNDNDKEYKFEEEFEDSSNYKEFIGKEFEGSNVEEFIKKRGMYMRKITKVELEEGLEEDIRYDRIDVWVNDTGVIYRMENG